MDNNDWTELSTEIDQAVKANRDQGESKVYCWTVRWQERGRGQMFRHFYPKDPTKGSTFGYTESEATIFMAGVQTNMNIQHSSFHTIYHGSQEHRAMVAAAEKSANLLKASLQRRVQSIRVK